VDGGREKEIGGIGEMNRRRDMFWEACARRYRRDLAGAAGFGGSVRRIFPVPLTGRPRVGWPRFSLCPASPERPLWDGDGLGAPDTVSGRAGQKWALGDAAGTLFLSGAPQIPLGDALGDATGDALRA
jgi:hypothetical protein